jgi:hypothetical protein
MPVETFGVTPDSVRLLYFPHLDRPSASTSPSLSAQSSMVQEEAGELEGKLERQAISPASVVARGTTEAPYLWCAKTLGLMVAIRLAEVTRGSDSELLKRWREALKLRLDDLFENGADALGDASLETSTSPISGPTTHITQNNLTTDTAANMSTTVPRLRRDDLL